MKRWFAFVLLITLVSAYAVYISAQESNDTGQTVENLRAELSRAHDRIADLKIRLEQLNFDLQPENIERYFNGAGSTRPEELRESRRRQLQTEKDRVAAQLEELASSCQRLETAINTEQVRAFQQNTLGAATLQTDQKRTTFFTLARVLIGVVTLCAVLGGIAFHLLMRGRRNV
jgi:uncharacterized protein YlxW (UPF0749 family)